MPATLSILTAVFPARERAPMLDSQSQTKKKTELEMMRMLLMVRCCCCCCW